LYTETKIVAKVVVTVLLVSASMQHAETAKMDKFANIFDDMEAEISNRDVILEKMMPKDVLKQLKEGNTPNAKEYDCVTIFFSDICNFTVLSGETDPKDMIDTLNALWREYDEIASRWGIYKVETIGDAYLGVAGCPDQDPNHAISAVNFALDIIDMVDRFKTKMGTSIRIRVGLHSGKITAGVLGELNPHWCIVGI
jgi:class 3 adenylate cyclase